jgi:hypothetical protein
VAHTGLVSAVTIRFFQHGPHAVLTGYVFKASNLVTL